MNNKKAVSPIIGAVLLIGILFILGFGYFLWTRGFLSNFGKEAEGEAACRNIQFSVGDVCFKTQWFSGKTFLVIGFLARNDGTTKIKGFDLRLEYEGGAKSTSSSVGSEIEGESSKDIESNPIDIEGIGIKKRVIIYPRIKIMNSLFDCEEKKFIKIWEEVSQC